mmetsp:Transcript_11261/g.16048  ORF Transcript_11261/g.16048 Transcript_11261/m.16048 type:complete len:405 (-) Transcript_11261:144-1358(-)|eukprot:CAMPEP_0202459356 /NCGR_PEP_ID=MMETSP1360-20130828/34957_1 /ASSEMBLY_ACC=CAM_ASM_000848 /TAXON_ID=515479 /ORGANISM="Licmophora paradoxa, Strain CCMP2313" /LENGTH=404 /DNA_ID=CAMNT_0049080395 /DNA_START=201 /DNA_END=1415 /DNA_ORIENTATION=+
MSHHQYYNHPTSFDAAALPFDALGPAARPLEFPSPTVHRASIVTLQAMDHRTRKVHTLKSVLLSFSQDRAYLFKKKLSKSTNGTVRLAVVLERRKRRKSKERVEWESTEQLIAIKISSWASMRRFRGRHLEDPIKEISAMQLLGNYHPNVVGTIEVLQNDENLYTVMQYCGGGDLFSRVTPTTTSSSDAEDKARSWFRQLLCGLFHLQRKGVCHRDISLENLLLDDKENLKILDFGLSLRVPHVDPANPGGASDVSEGTERRLMEAQGQGGKLLYMAPEVVSREDAFDGFAIDLWAAGIILFILLIGLAPFQWAHGSDARYAKISSGKLRELLNGLNIELSPEAIDLLQNMFWEDPARRLTLAQVMQHPWTINGKKTAVSPRSKITPKQHVGTPPFQYREVTIN